MVVLWHVTTAHREQGVRGSVRLGHASSRGEGSGEHAPHGGAYGHAHRFPALVLLELERVCFHGLWAARGPAFECGEFELDCACGRVRVSFCGWAGGDI